jgi:predicted transposase/invertase (TIGR01784 family)
VQVRRYGAWHKRGLFYLARTLGGQLSSGDDYGELRASVGLHLLDFDLFTATERQRQQALWRFEMRDETQPQVSLGNILQMNLVELNKADRLGLPPGPLRAWITFFKHWQEELTMASITHEPVQQAMDRIRQLSADEEARRLAFVRERALRDEVSFLNEAKQEGWVEGRQEALKEAEEQILKTKRATARSLMAHTEMVDQMIAEIADLPIEEVKQLRAEIKR